MRIAAFSDNESQTVRLGVVSGPDAVVDLAAAAGPGAPAFLGDMLAFLRAGETALAAAGDLAASGRGLRALADVRLRPPVSRPGKILAMGFNYDEHRAEAGGAPRPPYPEGFVKLPSAVVGPGDPIVAWPQVRHLDYEVELAVVIGRSAHNVPAADALAFVGGYTVANDVSARDWQQSERGRGRSPLMGKNFPTFCPLGPWLVTCDEVPDPQRLRLTLDVNGERRQAGRTSDMVFTVREMVAHWSQLRLEPGDVLLTGTPAGVAHARKPDPTPYWLKPGDVVEAAVEGLGVLRNVVVAQAAGGAGGGRP